MQLRVTPPTLLLVFGAIVLVSPSVSQAFTFQVTELSGCESGATTGCIGEDVTIGVRILNDGGADGIPDGVFAVGSSFSDYSPDVVSFVDGNAVSSILGTTCVPSVGCLLGITNTVGPALAETDGGVTFFSGASLSRGEGPDGSRDPGLDGVIDGGDAQFRATFRVTGSGTTTIRIGVNPARGDLVFATESYPDRHEVTNAFVVISSDAAPYVVPEPGTALLVGAGLATLGLGRRSPGRRPVD